MSDTNSRDEKRPETPDTQPQQEQGAGGALPQAEDAALETELEGLRDTFQQELDKAAQAADGSGEDTPPEADENAGDEEDEGTNPLERIVDWDNLIDTSVPDIPIDTESLVQPDGQADEEEAFDETLCLRCQKNERDTSVREDYPYCEKCRNEMKKYPISWAVIPLVIVLIIGVIFAGYTIPSAVSEYAPVAAADKLMLQKKPTDSLNAYFALYEQGTSTPAMIKKMVKALWDNGYTQDVAYLINAEYTPEELEKGSNKEIRVINEKVTAFNATAQALAQVFAEYESTPAAEIPYDELIGKIDALTDTEDAKYDEAIKLYYKYYAAKISGKPANDRLNFLNEMGKVNKTDYKWLYLPKAAECQAELGDYDGAMNTVKKLRSANHGSPDAYALEAVIYRRQKAYDKAIAAADAGLAVSTDNPELLRQKAIVLLLQGENEAAKEQAKKAYETSTNVGTANTYAIVCHITKDNGEYDAILAMLKSYDTDLTATTKSFIEGKTTLEAIFLEGNGDIA